MRDLKVAVLAQVAIALLDRWAKIEGQAFAYGVFMQHAFIP